MHTGNWRPGAPAGQSVTRAWVRWGAFVGRTADGLGALVSARPGRRRRLPVLPGPVEPRQLRARRRLNPRCRRQPAHERLVRFFRVPPLDAPHRRIRFQRRCIDADRLPLHQTRLRQPFQHPREHRHVCFHVYQTPRACCAALRRPGELLTRGDVCHVHADRGEAERCGVLLRGAPELVRLDEVRSGLPRGVVAVERRERPATSTLPGLGNHDSRRPSVARLLATCGWQARPSRTQNRAP